MHELFRGLSVIDNLMLAFLIAFNSTNIDMHERSREIATMFAFGLHPVPLSG